VYKSKKGRNQKKNEEGKHTKSELAHFQLRQTAGFEKSLIFFSPSPVSSHDIATNDRSVYAPYATLIMIKVKRVTSLLRVQAVQTNKKKE
jgi:hypothetical protein